QQIPVRCPARVDQALAAALRELALRAFLLTGVRHYGRVDLRVDRHGQPWILEVNANPDLAPEAGLARAVQASGEAYDAFLARLVKHARAEATNAPSIQG
ncbi:MAG: hypothetical protein K6T86_14480, partial [Pirellulales bacterium]|nr:hypothetical protein [Pirellulales bacterium]